jgi:hypothetical protein
MYCITIFLLVFRIRIHRFHMFLGLPDPDPLVKVPVWVRIQNTDFYNSLTVKVTEIMLY